jgi:hypothetical protein
MVGTSGIVLASDRKWSISPVSGINPVRDCFTASKIEISESGTVAVAFARDMLAAHRVAKRITFCMDDEDVWERARRIYDIADRVAEKKNVECLIGFLRPEPCLWLFRYFKLWRIRLWTSTPMRVTHIILRFSGRCVITRQNQRKFSSD